MNNTEHQFLKWATEITEANLHNEQFGVSELAREMGISRATLHRKIILIAKTSVSKFICQIRLKKAFEHLKQNSATISEIAYDCGFHSVTYFTKCFHEFYGFSPGEVLKGLHQPMEELQIEPKKTSFKKTSIIKVLVVATVVLVLVVILLFFKYQQVKQPVQKSIAVLPFINDSADTSYVYFINGVTEAIITNLSAIADLRVVSRSSVEQYRNNKTKSIPEIARELGVNYIVEGSGQKTVNNIRLSVQLIDARSDRHIFSQLYERDLEEIFNLQSEIALSVADKINAVITPEEKKQIESKPTKNIAALNQYLKGNELRQIADLENNKELFKQAELFLRKAIVLDSAYIAPYVGLGWIFNVAYGNLDSGLCYANRALHFDPNNPYALGLKGWILMHKLSYTESKEVLEQAISFNPNNYQGYQIMGVLGFFTGEYANSISYKLKAFKMVVSNYEKGVSLIGLCKYLYLYGFYEDGLKFAEMQIEINNDSGMYYTGLACINLLKENDSTAIVNAVHAKNWKSQTWWQPFYVAVATKNPKATFYADQYIEDAKKQGQTAVSHYLGYAFRLNGENEKARLQFEGAIKKQIQVIEEKKENTTCIAYLRLMEIYSAMDNTKKALEYLRLYNTCNDFSISPFSLNNYKMHPIFENMRKEPEFQQFIKKHDDRIQPEMKKIEKILKNYWSDN
jgi:TolB-like protein/AraC-like DNA-binding protein